jgi:hypothetical protein
MNRSSGSFPFFGSFLVTFHVKKKDPKKTTKKTARTDKETRNVTSG